jgi:ATP-dependent RNA helicase RhlB
MVVIDECDRLFDMGFADDLRWLLRRLPRPADRQSQMFTATLSQRVTTLGWREMDNPLEVIIDPGQLTPDTIHQELYHVSTREKLSLLLGLLKREGEGRTMVFVNTRFEARRLVDDLRRHGFLARGLTGNVVQTKRLKVLDDFREGRLPILVATDVASRGLHIDGVTHVVNYDLPQDAEDYVHRIGRTARVGAEGKAFSLACEDYVYSLDAIQKYVGYDIPVAFAGDELYHEVLPREPRRARDRRSDGGGSRRPSSRDGSRRRDERPRTRDDRPPQTPTAAPDSQASTDGGDPPPAPPKRRRRRRRRPGGPPAASPEGSGSGGGSGES